MEIFVEMACNLSGTRFRFCRREQKAVLSLRER